jgi:uncharacterized SAM-binding protein YcdF (DUF218 family)
MISQEKRKKHPYFITSVILLLITCTFALIFHERILESIGEYLVIKDNLQPADVIHVIAGKDYRTNYGIQLLQQGYGRTIFFAGGWCTEHQYFQAQHSKELAIEQGVSPDAIALDDSQVASTYDEAHKLLNFIHRNPGTIHTVMVVSDPYHMRRAQWAFRRVLGSQIDIQMAPIPYELTPLQQQWWSDRDTTEMVIREYLKLIYYPLRYQISSGWFKAWLAGLDRE